jgi:hypothetical protein
MLGGCAGDRLDFNGRAEAIEIEAIAMLGD